MIRIMEGINFWNWTEYEEMAFEPRKVWQEEEKDMQSERTEEPKMPDPGDVPLRDRCATPGSQGIHLGPLSQPICWVNDFLLRSITVWTQGSNFTLPRVPEK